MAAARLSDKSRPNDSLRGSLRLHAPDFDQQQERITERRQSSYDADFYDTEGGWI
eukprot:CAMPEP_0185584428 /NCGR_PEP_ID=MMETSP0434-20130131/32171_1 /TAXON_ID=626734 ORGANISM="Favella taraikaensis, Strain Fe Narragansett Bay" /NCGR_SAMPLE_ID=MMETSP0434 /ASSEMBLY_ACC=CAM_ASM_000379 /LENGTH=54 /DNA_ID=CAMNT_0028204151 /DNA_START=2170 /DNA_END=2334 /DNA_ORIENTATION=-